MAEVVATDDLTRLHRTAGRWTTGSDAKTARNSTPRFGWEKTHAAAERATNTTALAAIVDRGRAAALEYAELVESPATHGAVLISIWFDLAEDGNLRHRVSYERSLE